MIAMTGCAGGSPLCVLADAVLDAGVDREADPWDLVPTASTVVTARRGRRPRDRADGGARLRADDFHAHHPAARSANASRAAAAVNEQRRPVCVVGSFMIDLVVQRAAPAERRARP